MVAFFIHDFITGDNYIDCIIYLPPRILFLPFPKIYDNFCIC